MEVDANDFLKDTKRLCAGVIRQFQSEQEIRDDTKDSVGEVISDEVKRQEVRAALDVFFDGRGARDTQASTLLGLAECWGNKTDPSTWQTLDSHLLGKLFNLQRDQDDFEFKCELFAQRGVFAPERRHLVTFSTEQVIVIVKYPDSAPTCSIRGRVRSGCHIVLTELSRQNCTETPGQALFEIPPDRFKKAALGFH